jgi:peroxiredoxin
MSAQANTSRSYAKLTPGDPAPWFHQRATSNPNYAFDTAAGRYIVLCFYASAGDAVGRAAIKSVLANRKQFDDERCCFFGVSLDPRDEAEGRVRESLPGIRFFWDEDGTISRLYGAVPKDAKPGESAVPARQMTAAQILSSAISSSCRRPNVSRASKSRLRSCSFPTCSSRSSAAI